MPMIDRFPHKLEVLRTEARKAAKWRGHNLKQFERDPTRAHIAYSECRDCGAHVTINMRPMPNEIDVGGSAVAVNCKQSEANNGRSSDDKPNP